MKNCVDPAVLVPEKKTFFSLQVTVFNPGNSWIHFFYLRNLLFEREVAVIPSFKGFDLILSQQLQSSIR